MDFSAPMQSQIKVLPPTRTILATNFTSSEELDKFINLLPKPSVFEHYSIPNALCVFVTFFDIRVSVRFFQNFREKEGFDHLQFNYTISKNEIQRNNEDTSEKHNQSSVIIYFKNVDFECQDATVIKFLEQFGEVKEIRMSKIHQKILEFFDMRVAKKAVQALDGTPFGSGVIKIKFVWDTMAVMKQEYIKKTDSILKPLLKEAPIDNETVKKFKLNTISANERNPNVNELLDTFDKFISSNFEQIENMFKHNYTFKR
ncbi:hypothetical protein NUSPORA_01190 [Nucleospora cyclopteri]